jgi:hypothetical protein
MGTNYYTRKKCECCGNVSEDNDLHIGKSSGGWKFLFAPYPNEGLTSWRAWRTYLANSEAPIFDEYGEQHSFAALIALVESKQKPENLDADTADATQYGPTPRADRHRYETADADGYRFSTTDDFS